jgi:hypothetical protein
MQCEVCSKTFKPVQRTQKFCSKSCRNKSLSSRRDPEKRRINSGRYYERNRVKVLEKARKDYHVNPTRKRRYSGYRYSSITVPFAERIKKIAGKATDRQKGVLADWLLAVGHISLEHHEVDHFVADYNTQGI